MEKSKMRLKLALTLLVAVAAPGCGGKAPFTGSFDKTLRVDGPVRLELGNAAGDIRVVAGPPGQVEIHGSFEAHAWPWQNVQSQVAELSSNPPIEQSQNLIRINLRPFAGLSLRSLVADYSITAPDDTEVRIDEGSGEIYVEGVRGPVHLTTGSGTVTADQIGSDAWVRAGSGTIRLRDLHGEADVTSGQGDLNVANISGDLRATSGAGNITVENARGTVSVKTGAGDIRITGASDDVRAHGGMGDLAVEGNPRAASYWELHTGMGDLALRVPGSASFQLHAHTGLGEIHSELSGLRTEHSAHELRGQVGNGGGRIEIETGMGDIRIQPAASPATGQP